MSPTDVLTDVVTLDRLEQLGEVVADFENCFDIIIPAATVS